MPSSFAGRTSKAILIVGLLCTPLNDQSALAGVDECNDAISNFETAKSSAQSAADDYLSCVQSTDGNDDCGSQFSDLDSAQTELADAVSSYESECGN